MSAKREKAVSNQNVKNGFPANIIRGFISGIIAFIGFTAIFSLVILKTSIPEKYFFIMVLISSALSALMGSLIACVNNKSKNLIIGMSVAIALLLAEFVILLCFNNAKLSNNIYFMFPSVLALGFIGCVIGTNIRKK